MFNVRSVEKTLKRLQFAKKDLMVNYCSFMVWRLKKLQQTRNIVFHRDTHTFK